jgi:hypothetical protein
MICDIMEFRALGQTCRPVGELDIPAETWRAAMRRAARRKGMRIRTFLTSAGPSHLADPGHPLPDQVVCAVRTDLPFRIGRGRRFG